MRERAGADLSEAVEFADVFDLYDGGHGQGSWQSSVYSSQREEVMGREVGSRQFTVVRAARGAEFSVGSWQESGGKQSAFEGADEALDHGGKLSAFLDPAF